MTQIEGNLPTPAGGTRGSVRGLLLLSMGVGTLIAAILLVGLLANGTDGDGGAQSPPGEVPSPTRPAPIQPAPPTTRPIGTSLDPISEVFFRMIRISYAAGGNAPARNPRSREEAVALAAEIMRQLEAGEASFDALATELSDHPSSANGGALPRMRLGQLPPPMRDALAVLPVGQQALVPIEGENALFILRRYPLPPVMAAQQILIRTSDTSLGGPADNRSRDEARALAEKVIVRALAPAADFNALVEEFSEDPGKMRGGRIGPFPAEMMPAAYTAAVTAVEEWEVCPEPVPSDLGFLVLRRIPLEDTEPPVPSGDPVPAPTTGVDPARVPTAKTIAPAGERAVGYEILISYRGATAANLRIKRTREEAEARAQAVVSLARSRGTDFKELVERYSEARSVQTGGGSLGVLVRARRVHVGHDVVFALSPQQVSDTLDTDRGFRIFQRLPLEEIGLRDILITYRGAKNASPKLERTREEARAIAEAARARLEAGEGFSAVARTVSDQRRSNGGALGVLHRQHPFFRQFPGHLERGFELDLGEHSEVFESSWGFHVIERDRVLRARHLRIAYAGKRAVPRQASNRPRAEAEAMIAAVAGELASGRRSFRELVVEHSEDPDARRGGDTGVFGPGQREDELFAAVAALEPGQTSGIVETAFGFEIFQRLPLDGAR